LAVSLGVAHCNKTDSQPEIAIHPGPDGHGTTRVIKTLSPVPLEGIGVTFVAVA
jgi:hypothetical protein